MPKQVAYDEDQRMAQSFSSDHNHSSGTIKKYTQAVSHFLTWYSIEEQASLTLATITPIALIGYYNELQQEQRKSVSTINLRVSALRAWCGWMTDQGYLATDPAARVKLIGGQEESKREGLSSTQINALLRQTQLSRESERNYAILQMLVQTGIRLSECSALALTDITFGERSGMLQVHKGKGKKVRSVPLNASARAAIVVYVAPRLSTEKPSLKTVAAKWPRPTSAEAFAPLWVSQKGGALTTSAMGQMIAEVVNAAGDLVPGETSATLSAIPSPAIIWRNTPMIWLVWRPCSDTVH